MFDKMISFHLLDEAEKKLINAFFNVRMKLMRTTWNLILIAKGKFTLFRKQDVLLPRQWPDKDLLNEFSLKIGKAVNTNAILNL